MNDLEQIRDALESAKTFLGQEILWKESNYVRGHGEKKYSELCVALSIIDRMIETPAPQGCVDDQPKCTWDFYRSTLERFVHETTHLSPQNDDGSHDCKISKKCLLHGRIALELLGKLSAAPTPAPTEKVDYKQLKQLVFMWAADVNGAPLDSDICEIINIIRR